MIGCGKETEFYVPNCSHEARFVRHICVFSCMLFGEPKILAPVTIHINGQLAKHMLMWDVAMKLMYLCVGVRDDC